MAQFEKSRSASYFAAASSVTRFRDFPRRKYNGMAFHIGKKFQNGGVIFANQPMNLELFRQRVDHRQSHANIAKGADTANQDLFHMSNSSPVFPDRWQARRTD